MYGHTRNTVVRLYISSWKDLSHSNLLFDTVFRAVIVHLFQVKLEEDMIGLSYFRHRVLTDFFCPLTLCFFHFEQKDFFCSLTLYFFQKPVTATVFLKTHCVFFKNPCFFHFEKKNFFSRVPLFFSSKMYKKSL